jgi:membrane-associated progesterone receptor component
VAGCCDACASIAPVAYYSSSASLSTRIDIRASPPPPPAVQVDAGLFLAAKGRVFDVSAGAAFYGPGGGYHFFCGRDASRGLAKSSLDVATLDERVAGDLSGLTEEELGVLDEWCAKFEAKYPVVGTLLAPTPSTARL